MIYNLFYGFYLSAKKHNSRNPTNKAMGVISLIVMINVTTVLSIIKGYIYSFNIDLWILFAIIIGFSILLVKLIYSKVKIQYILRSREEYSIDKNLKLKRLSNLYYFMSFVFMVVFIENLFIT
ncbi:MAG: hypothetical protein DRI74_06905 [Bacteroidetes bacterium]|nr:MAG: hypothetical protein DRI74_06905 [Bacteroidota bacterium]